MISSLFVGTAQVRERWARKASADGRRNAFGAFLVVRWSTTLCGTAESATAATETVTRTAYAAEALWAATAAIAEEFEK